MNLLPTLLTVIAVIGVSHAAPIEEEEALEQYLDSSVLQQSDSEILEAQMQGWLTDALSKALQAAGKSICSRILGTNEPEQVLIQIIDNEVKMMEDRAKIVENIAEAQFVRKLVRGVGDWWQRTKGKIMPRLRNLAGNISESICTKYFPDTDMPTMSQEEMLLQKLLKAAQAESQGGFNFNFGGFDPSETELDEEEEVQMQGWFKDTLKGVFRSAGRKLCDNIQNGGEDALTQYFDGKVEVMQYEDEDDAKSQLFKKLMKKAKKWWKKNKERIRPILRNAGRKACDRYFPQASQETVNSERVQKLFQALLNSAQNE